MLVLSLKRAIWRETMTKITLLGTGAMGSRFAEKMIEAGFDVSVFNRTKKHALQSINNGATFAATPVEAVKDADVVISMLTNDEASKKVWLEKASGAIHGLKKEAIAIESSTLSSRWINDLAHEFMLRDIQFVDAPVVGSRPQADSGNLIFLIGGDKTALNKLKPVLSKMSSSIFHVGPVGSGIKMKLAVNALFGVQVSALSEVVAMMQKSGIEKDKMLELFSHLPITSPALQGIGKLISENKFEPLFPITLVEKDFAYALEMAASFDSKMPVVNATHTTYKAAIEGNYGNENIAAVVQLYL